MLLLKHMIYAWLMPDFQVQYIRTPAAEVLKNAHQ